MTRLTLALLLVLAGCGDSDFTPEACFSDGTVISSIHSLDVTHCTKACEPNDGLDRMSVVAADQASDRGVRFTRAELRDCVCKNGAVFAFETFDMSVSDFRSYMQWTSDVAVHEYVPDTECTIECKATGAAKATQ